MKNVPSPPWPCPVDTCKRPAYLCCVNPNGSVRLKPHPERMKLAPEPAAPEVKP